MQESLRHSLSEHTPFYMEKGYEEPLDVLFQLDYNVIHLDQALADRLNQVRDPRSHATIVTFNYKVLFTKKSSPERRAESTLP